MKHPKPWKAMKQRGVGRWQVRTATGQFVCELMDHATALEIVSAVNSREKLVEALEGIVEQCDDSEWSENETVEAIRDSAHKALSEGGAQ